ncbi:MAG: hypothetical protein KatS3mg105_1468 [Gemmatales bacterium]|nr:MAG: hypothetical protein KatS3mg105_1468 [Gemmatales bacterium]
MAQRSRCANCGSSVVAHSVAEGRAFFRCGCGRRWSTKAYYGHEGAPLGGAGVGAAVGGILGGVPGAVIGGLLGAIAGAPVTCRCIACGGTGYSTGRQGKLTGYQCSNCKRTWVKKQIASKKVIGGSYCGNAVPRRNSSRSMAVFAC